jgi:hypothetical protein
MIGTAVAVYMCRNARSEIPYMKNIHLLVALSLTIVLIAHRAVAQSHVATVTKYTSSAATTISQAFPSTSTGGHMIVVHLSWDNKNRSVKTLTDNQGNVYHRINGPTTWHSTYRSELWYTYNIIGGSKITVTATLTNSSTSFLQIYASEYSGVSITDPLDQHSVAAGSTSAANSGAETTTVSNELVYGVSIGASGSLATGAGFTNRSTANQNIVEDKLTSSIGSYSTTFTSAGGDWVAEMATFKPLIVLPVELISFKAEVLGPERVQTEWVTAGETNNDYFEIQRSSNGNDWAVAGNVKGAGSPNTTTQYSAIDNMPYAGLSYYRLAQFGLDGKPTFSRVAAVHIDPQPETRIRAYPNPAGSYLIVEGENAGLQQACVFNAIGQYMNEKIRITNEGGQRISLDLSLLSKGLYFLKTANRSLVFYKQ